MTTRHRQSKKLQIVLGDFCHTTKIMANNYVPLNIGTIKSYTIKRYESDINIVLYKSYNQLLDHIQNNNVDILGVSHYAWNSELSQFVLKRYKEINPDGISVLGGPNFTKDQTLISAWLRSRSFIDYVIDREGELPFANIVQERIANSRKEMFGSHTIRGCYFLIEGKEHAYKDEEIIDDLNTIPSPYLAGYLDEFILNKIDGFDLFPLFESTRGCPFKCAFCRNSVEHKNMRAFEPKRFLKEVEYVAHLFKKNNKSRPLIMLADQNFGMYERDQIIAEGLQRIQDTYGFPERVIVTTGKGSYQKILRALKIFPTVKMTFSVQSLDDEVLSAVSRKNFPLNIIKEYHDNVKKRGEYTVSEIIVGLPKDSREKHLQTINTLLSVGIDHITPFSFMMLKGTLAETETFRKAYQYKTKWRILPGGFSEIDNIRIFESEEIVLSTNTLSFDDYLFLRKMHLWVWVLFNGSVFKELKKLIVEEKIGFDTFLLKVDEIANSQWSTPSLKKIIQEFLYKSEHEFFTNTEELYKYYAKHYDDLLNDRSGENLILKYSYQLYLSIDDVIEVVIRALGDLLTIDSSEKYLSIFALMKTKAECISLLFMGNPPSFSTPKFFTSKYDLVGWLSNEARRLDSCSFESLNSYKNYYPDKMIEDWNTVRDQYGRYDEGRGKVLYKMGQQVLSPEIECFESKSVTPHQVGMQSEPGLSILFTP